MDSKGNSKTIFLEFERETHGQATVSLGDEEERGHALSVRVPESRETLQSMSTSYKQCTAQGGVWVGSLEEE